MHSTLRPVAGIFLVSLMWILAGCGNSSSQLPPPPPPPPAEFLFATSNDGILTFSVDISSGALTLEPSSNTVSGTFGIATTPSASFLYASNGEAGTIAGFSISKTGGLSAVSGSPFLLPDNSPAAIYPPVDNLAMHPSGNFLYAPDIPGNEVAGFAIDHATGNLTAIPGSPFPAGASPLQVAVVRSGAFLYASNFGDSTISGFTIDPSTGTLTSIAGSPFAVPDGSPDGLVIHPSGKFLYGVVPYAGGFGPPHSDVAAFSIDQTSGSLTAIQGSPFSFGGTFAPDPYSIAQDPSGKYLYALGSADGNIYEFSIDAGTGALTPLAGSPYNQGVVLYASDLTVDPSGKFLYFMDEVTSDLGILKIDGTTGTLSAASPSFVSTGHFPLGLTVVSIPQQ